MYPPSECFNIAWMKQWGYLANNQVIN